VIQSWPTISSKPLGDYRVFSVRAVDKFAPRTGRTHEFYLIDCVNWVNVIALTPDRQVVMVEQYRHGSDTIELEIPGGMIDSTDADPLSAGLRELREETGYAGENARIIGQVFPNPAIMTNVNFTVFVENCHLAGATAFDHTEDLSLKLVPVDELGNLVAAQKIRHSIIIAALYQFDLWRKKEGK